jgi:hypothetical protein
LIDPLLSLGAQNQRLTENTQRSSDALRTQQQKESKDKTRRAGEVDSSDLSPDANPMGDDLMGSMDPDLQGGSGRAELFRKLWEEEVERGQEPEEPGQPETLLDEAVPQAPQEETAAPLPSAPRPEAPAARPETPGASATPPEVPGTPPPDQAPSCEGGGPAPRPPQDRVEAGPSAAPEPPPDRPTPEPAGARSLLETEGFLLWEARVGAAGEEPEEERQEEPVAPDLAEVLGQLISGDRASPGYPRLQRLLARFGLGVLRLCAARQVQVYLLPRGAGLASFPLVRNRLPELAGSGAAYLPQTRTCLVEEECLLAPPQGFHPVLFYFAQAYDHALGGEDFASLRSPAVKANFEACRAGLPGHRFSDGLAASSPALYFAQALESYLGENDCVEPLWTREDLYDLDRSMHDYVAYLLGQGNRSR